MILTAQFGVADAAQADIKIKPSTDGTLPSLA